MILKIIDNFRGDNDIVFMGFLSPYWLEIYIKIFTDELTHKS